MHSRPPVSTARSGWPVGLLCVRGWGGGRRIVEVPPRTKLAKGRALVTDSYSTHNLHEAAVCRPEAEHPTGSPPPSLPVHPPGKGLVEKLRPWSKRRPPTSRATSPAPRYGRRPPTPRGRRQSHHGPAGCLSTSGSTCLRRLPRGGRAVRRGTCVQADGGSDGVGRSVHGSTRFSLSVNDVVRKILSVYKKSREERAPPRRRPVVLL